MTFDLILRNARIAGTKPDTPLMDIGIQGGRIAAIEPGLTGDGEQRDVAGNLLSPV